MIWTFFWSTKYKCSVYEYKLTQQSKLKSFYRILFLMKFCNNGGKNI